MKNYLVKKLFTISGTKNVNYYDWYLEKFVENENRTPLKKLYTMQFTNYEKALEIAKKYNAKIVEIDLYEPEDALMIVKRLNQKMH